jgi:hypothetical protein
MGVRLPAPPELFYSLSEATMHRDKQGALPYGASKIHWRSSNRNLRDVVDAATNHFQRSRQLKNPCRSDRRPITMPACN